jgi:hypothetical protein
MSELRLHDMNIISKEELMTLNQRNEDLALNVKQIEHFLNVQHSLGKILYFDNDKHIILFADLTSVTGNARFTMHGTRYDWTLDSCSCL